jgi:hypothetical protein
MFDLDHALSTDEKIIWFALPHFDLAQPERQPEFFLYKLLSSAGDKLSHLRFMSAFGWTLAHLIKIKARKARLCLIEWSAG